MTQQTLPSSADVAIIGGGMVGFSLALLLARALPTLKILLIEAMDLGNRGVSEKMPPSFDARSTALSEGSREILHQCGLWERVAPETCPITTIHVSDRGHPGATRMTAEELCVDGLGYVVENRKLGQQMIAEAVEADNLQVCAPCRIEKLQPIGGGMELHSGQNRCLASLAVVADGAESPLLQKLGIYTHTTDYRQTALIANIALAKPHGGVAYERFTDEGPMALLPLPDSEGEHRSALVWTLDSSRVDNVMDLPQEQFLIELHRRFGFRAGRFMRRGECATYPLKLMVAEEQVRSNLVVAGNAAHFLHPVAGQGFNLALRDVARLAETLAEACRCGDSMGSLPVLERYLSAQALDQRNTIAFSNTLPAVFGLGNRPGIALRNMGLVALDLLGPLRHEFARFGAGMAYPGVRPYE